ncbi:MAG: hypothetical protein HN368_19925 [Spirochaetales bacterium]|nr:hypothetical protein [Spirochaetales bacterium]
MPDTLDFSMTPWTKDSYNEDLLSHFDVSENDILILQATRIVKRKGIELLLPILEKLNDKKYLKQLIGRKLYNGKTITESSKFILILAGYAEKEAVDYLNDITSNLKSRNIPYRNIQAVIGAEREQRESGKQYSLFDTYTFADIVSYPSLFEGWGNQFLEAVFAKKPIIAFEYPVFITDIKPCGYEVISLGSTVLHDDQSGFLRLPNQIINNACKSIVETLVSHETIKKLENNFNVGKANNSRNTLKELMTKSLVLA